MILSQLYVVDAADFLFVQRQTGLTQGNMSSHLSKLETAGYIAVEREFVGKKPLTLLRLTAAGRVALESYVERMKPLLDSLALGHKGASAE